MAIKRSLKFHELFIFKILLIAIYNLPNPSDLGHIWAESVRIYSGEFGSGVTLALHRLRNKFLQNMLISLDSAAWELARNVWANENVKVDTDPGNQTWDLITARPTICNFEP